MKIKILTLLVLSLFIASCEDELNPNADFLERNILTSVIGSDSSFQVVTLSRSYEVEGLDPKSNIESHYIKGADVKVWYNDKVYQFVEDTLERVDKSRYNFPVSIYYNDELSIEASEGIEIEALLPNGLLLKSSTEIPKLNEIKFTNSSKYIHPDSLNNEYIQFRWNWQKNTYYHPLFVIRYYNKALGDGILREKIVPLEYNGNTEKIFTRPSSNNAVSFPLSNFVAAVNEIVNEGTGNKDDYSILRGELKLIVYDNNLSAYYSSVGTFLDGFTIKVDQPDFSNVEGGFGIFGSYAIKRYTIIADREYMLSLGFGER